MSPWWSKMPLLFLQHRLDPSCSVPSETLSLPSRAVLVEFSYFWPRTKLPLPPGLRHS